MSSNRDTSSTPDSSHFHNAAMLNNISCKSENMFDSAASLQNHFSIIDSKNHHHHHSSNNNNMDSKEKVERCPNFSEAEKQRFIELFEENKEVLLNNGRKPNLAELKKEVWDKIAAEMNSTVSLHLPRTVNQLQTFWKNASVRTKNRFKDIQPADYTQLPPLTAKILQLADEASAAYQNSQQQQGVAMVVANFAHAAPKRNGRQSAGAKMNQSASGDTSAASFRVSPTQSKEEAAIIDCDVTTSGLNGQEFSHVGSNGVNHEDSSSLVLVVAPSQSPLYDIEYVSSSSSSSDGVSSGGASPDNTSSMSNGAGAVGRADLPFLTRPIDFLQQSQHNSISAASQLATGGNFDWRQHKQQQNAALQRTVNSVVKSALESQSGRHVGNVSENIMAMKKNPEIIARRKLPQPVKVIHSTPSALNNFSDLNSPLKQQNSNNHNNINVLNNNINSEKSPNSFHCKSAANRSAFSWDKFSDLCEKRAKVKRKSEQIELKNRTLQTRIDANLAKKMKYEEQANFYRLKCLEMSAAMQNNLKQHFTSAAWFMNNSK